MMRAPFEKPATSPVKRMRGWGQVLQYRIALPTTGQDGVTGQQYRIALPTTTERFVHRLGGTPARKCLRTDHPNCSFSAAQNDVVRPCFCPSHARTMESGGCGEKNSTEMIKF